MAIPHLIIDDFLAAADAAQLLAQMLAAEPNFTPSLIGTGGDAQDAKGFRSSMRLPGRVGVDLDLFRAAIHARFDALCAATGIAPFPIYHTECSIVSHGDGDYYRTHIDTQTGGAQVRHYRVLSCVYYLNGEPKAYGGGELAIHAMGNASVIRIAPQHNRLVAFPAFIPHEVLPISCPDGGFANSRLSINCWLHRERAGAD
jgi:SM-20-related protein